MQNISNQTDLPKTTFSFLIVYYPLLLILIGTICNFCTLIILCRTTFRNTNKRPTLHYMRAIAVLDTIILYGWNFDQFLQGTLAIQMITYSVLSCKIFSFTNYLTYHVSAWLRVLICLDRYLSLSRLHRTWFSISRNVLILIGGIFLIFILLNFHFLLFVCYDENARVNIDALDYRVYPMWDHLNLLIYNCLPFLFMLIFNSGIIYHLISLRRLSTIRKHSRIQHGAISATLLITTCLFFLMTTPSSIAYAYFSQTNETILYALDSLLYTYHILSFPIYFSTFGEFRREFLKLVTFEKCPKSPDIPQIHFSEPSQTDKPNTNAINRLFTISHTSWK